MLVLTPQQATRLNDLNAEVKQLKCPQTWTWGAKENTNQGIYNNERMKLCMNKELQHKITHCKKCGSTGNYGWN